VQQTKEILYKYSFKLCNHAYMCVCVCVRACVFVWGGLQQENLCAFCPYFTSFFHLALDLTKIYFVIQTVPLIYHTL
jgi:hypothetical protein